MADGEEEEERVSGAEAGKPIRHHMTVLHPRLHVYFVTPDSFYRAARYLHFLIYVHVLTLGANFYFAHAALKLLCIHGTQSEKLILQTKQPSG